MKKIIFVLAIIMFVPFVARAEEETIRSFNSNIIVHEDSSMTVAETIVVYAGHNEINHGIYRDFPTRYKDEKGYNYMVGFTVEKVLLDGAPVQYAVSSVYNGKRVKIGDPNSLVLIGWHTYEITYTTNRQLGYFQDHDELYWNVTGNGWAFPIEKASARIILPTGIDIGQIQITAYTGRQGEKGADYNNKFLENSFNVSVPYFETTRILAPKEGLSIVVGWPKGFVTEPTRNEKIIRFIQDNFGLILGIIGLIFGIIYYCMAWYWQGRDPKKGVTIAQYEPPANTNAAQIRFLRRYGYDNKVFVAAILEFAVKGFITIAEKKKIFKKYYVLTKVLSPKNNPTPEDNKKLHDLFGASDSIEIGDEYHANIAVAIKNMKKFLQDSMGKYFTRNIGLWLVGVAIFIISLLLVGSQFLALLIFLAIPSLAAIMIFYFLLRKPTVEGRKILDHIGGFKWFLEVTEKDRMNFHNPPGKMPELFEKFLPYALALGVEHKWAEQFFQVFKSMEAQGTPYHPLWYVGAGFNPTNPAAFGNHFGSSLNHAIASSSVKPGSSSGFGGGGGSGGGGGGGGGGGW